MLIQLKQKVGRHLLNFPGWRTNRKIVVIESDDWGSIRMPSKTAFKALLKAGIRVDKCPYNRYDTLASESDLSHLFEVLTSVKDSNGRYPVITANAIMTNPDFEKIRGSDFRIYFHELFTKTLQKYPGCNHSWNLWQEGMKSGVFHPQLHGREHLNVGRWMRALQSKSPETQLAFQHSLFGISTTITQEKRRSYQAALDYDTSGDKAFIVKSVKEGAALFQNFFGHRSTSFIAPNYCWDNDIEKALQAANIHVLQSGRVQKTPIGAGRKVIRHYMGQKNTWGQVYLVRNCIFEPSITGSRQAVENCLADIRTAFFWCKPAIISSHRLNYIGTLDSKNSYTNLRLLTKLLKTIKQQWPEVEFWNSAQLGQQIRKQLLER